MLTILRSMSHDIPGTIPTFILSEPTSATFPLWAKKKMLSQAEVEKYIGKIILSLLDIDKSENWFYSITL